MKTSPMKFAPSLLACVLGALGLAVSEIPAKAQVYTWIGPGGSETSPGGTSTWNTSSNWSGGIPASGITTELDFGNSGSNAYTSENNIATYTLNKIVFTSTSSGLTTVTSVSAGIGGFTFDGTAPEIDQNGSGTAYLESAMTLNTNLTIGGTGAGLLELGAISGNFGVTFNGNGIYQLGTTTAVDSGWTGTTTLESGTLVVGANNQFASSSSLILNGGTLSLPGTRTLSNAVSFGGNVTVSDLTTTNTLTLAGAITTTAASTITTPIAMVLSGGVSNGASALTFNNTGTGTLTVNGTGATVGSAAMTFNNASSGLINITGNMIGSGGMVFGSNGSGKITLSGTAVSLGSGGIAVNGTGTGTTTISATTNLTSASSFTNSGLAAVTITGAITDNNFALDFVDSGTGALIYSQATAIGTGGWTTSGSGPGIITLGGLLSGTGSLTNAGATTTLSSASSTFSGGFVQNSGTTLISAGSTGGAGAVTQGPLGIGAVTLNGGRLGTSSSSETLSNAINIGAGANVIFGNAGSTGTFTLAGVTNIGNGAAIGAVGATAFSNSDFNANGSLELLANSGQLTLPYFDASSGLTIDFVLGSSKAVNFSGGFADFSGTQLLFNFSGGAAGTEYTVLDYSSENNFSLADLPTTLAGYSGLTWTIQSGDLEVEFASVPEPSPFLLLGLGALLLGAVQGIRNRFRLQAARQ